MVGLFTFVALLGLMCIALEFFLPGWILGIIGTTFLITTFFGFYSIVHTPLYLAGLVALYVVLITAVIQCSLSLVKRSKNHALFLKKDLEGFSTESINKKLIGHVGLAKTDLRLSGYITVQGQIYQAASEQEYIEKGSKIRITSKRNSYFIVTRR